MRVSDPFTCGWMLAERRDFTVATYSSTLGTGVRFTVCVLTGSGCGAGSFASVLTQPELVTATKANSPINKTTPRFLNLCIFLNLNVLYRCVPNWGDSICVLTGTKVSGRYACGVVATCSLPAHDVPTP